MGAHFTPPPPILAVQGLNIFENVLKIHPSFQI